VTATPPVLSIILVNWNTRDLLRACLRSLAAHPATGLTEIIVVDNASADGSAEMLRSEFPAVTLIANDRNAGFAEGNNQGLARAQGEFLLLLNPDTEVRPGALDVLIVFLRAHPEAGAVAPRLEYPDGRLQYSCRAFPWPGYLWAQGLGLARLFPRSRTFGGYQMTWWAHDAAREVDQPMASALLVRRAAYQAVGGFDPAFPIYFNDVDWCWRMRQAGWRIWYLPEAVVVHHLGASTRQMKAAMIAESHRGLLRFYAKHWRGRIGPFVYWPTVAGIALAGWARTLFAMLRGR